jgi:hypothetical protein
MRKEFSSGFHFSKSFPGFSAFSEPFQSSDKAGASL